MVVKVISFFCGCGGSSLGYKRAGCNVILASDWEKKALDIYQHNFPETKTFQADIRLVDLDVITNLTGIKKYELDILDGSPPCTPFSTCGLREEGWGKKYIHTADSKAQRSDDLFFEFIRLVNELRPKIIIAENVSGLIIGTAKGYYKQIVNQIKNIGYNTISFLLNAADFEVASSRKRVIIIGFRNDIKLNKSIILNKFPHQITFREVTEGIKNLDDELNFSIKNVNRFARQFISILPMGKSVKIFHKKGHYFAVKRESMDKPISTIIAANMNLIHPIENRVLTLLEAKRCSSFPDNFWFPSIRQGYERIGNSVPPNLMKHIARYAIQRANLEK